MHTLNRFVLSVGSHSKWIGVDPRLWIESMETATWFSSTSNDNRLIGRRMLGPTSLAAVSVSSFSIPVLLLSGFASIDSWVWRESSASSLLFLVKSE